MHDDSLDIGMTTLRIVCIGSSAGGLAPTIEFFKNMEPSCGLAFVVIQHLKADSPSLTPEILSRITRMTVTAAIDQERALPNHVYTMGPNTQLTIADGRFSVQPRTESPGRHKPFDRFLNSLAINSRERATAVILSGYDGDGSVGFVAIKAQGGSTYAQDRGALIDEMPEHAIETGCVDHVLDPGQIAERISSKC
jgi:two-component system CheB/CheR fusion protein